MHIHHDKGLSGVTGIGDNSSFDSYCEAASEGKEKWKEKTRPRDTMLTNVGNLYLH